MIWNGTTVAALLSTSSTAPTMPSGYTHKGLVGAIYNGSGSDFAWMQQINHRVARELATALSGGTATAYTSISLAAIVPPTARAVYGRAFVGDSASGPSLVHISPSDNANHRGTIQIQNIGGNALKAGGCISSC